MSMFVTLFIFVVLVGALVFIYEGSSAKDFKQFQKLSDINSQKIDSLLRQIEDLRKKINSITMDIEAAHGQADAAKSKAELAESLAHKVAIDMARKPTVEIASREPIKVEPIRVIIYDKRDLQNKTKTVKQPTPIKGKQKPLNN